MDLGNSAVTKGTIWNSNEPSEAGDKDRHSSQN